MHIRPFEIALIGFFAISAIVGVFILAGTDPKNNAEDRPFGEQVIVWGTFSKSSIDRIFTDLRGSQKGMEAVTYTQVDVRNFEETLVNAIAEGKSPDLIILPHELLVSQRAKLYPIPYESFPVRTFKDRYIDGAEIFMRSNGIYGIPFAVDPLVMYWNRDIFSAGGLSTPPRTWEALVSETVKATTRVNDRREISQSAIAFGEYSNVAHAKDILAMLFLQGGSSLVEEQNGKYRVTMNQSSTNALKTADAVLFFYTQFAIPSKELYTWNRSRSTDRTEFLNGTLALYFGKASEFGALERENPNLNFDVEQVPQGSDATVYRNYGDFYAFSIPLGAKNKSGAYALAEYLGNPTNAAVIAESFDFAPVHRSTLASGSADLVEGVRYKAALISRGWLDPSPSESDVLFRKMVEEIVANNNERVSDVVSDVVYQLENLF